MKAFAIVLTIVAGLFMFAEVVKPFGQSFNKLNAALTK